MIFLYSLLYIDDEPDLLEIGKIFLEQGGQFSVETVTSATTALDRMKSTSYDAIISDYMMPGMNGIELLKKVRTSGNTVPFILFTGRGREEVVIQAINEGADFYIQKGGDVESQFAELAHKIRQAIQQKLAQSSIRNLERREADLINFLPDATFAINAGGVVIAWNRAMEEMTGIPAREMLGKGNFEYALPFYGERRPILIDLVLTPGTEGADTHYKNIRREGPVLIVDTDQFCLRGKPVVLWGKASPLYDVSGTVVGAVETIRDITDRIRMEKALQESESNYRNLYQYAQVGLFKTSLEDGTILACNELFTTSTGYSSVEEAIGTNIASVYANPGDRKEVVRILCDQGYIRDFIARFRNKKTGRVFWALFSARLSREKGFVEGTVRDITEKKEAEEALRESRAQLRTLVDTLPDLVWLKDPNGVYLSCNRRFETFFGAAEKEIVGKTDYDFINRELADFFRRHDAAAIASGSPVANEEEVTFASDGHKEILETIKTPVFTSDGQVVGVLGVGRDITHRKRAEDEIRKSQAALEMVNAQLNEAQRIASIGSWTHHHSNRMPEWSRETFRIFGLDPQGGVPPYPAFRQLILPGQRQQLDEAVEAALKTGKGYSLELHIRRPDGEERIVHQKCETVAGNDGGTPYILGTSQDITDSRKINDALLASETLFRTLVESIMDPVLILSFDGRILFANPAAFTLVGHPDTGITGTQSIARFLDPESYKLAMSALETLRTSGRPVISEYLVTMLNGEKRWIEAFGVVIQYRGSGAELVTLRDITERKRSEEDLRQANRNLKLLSGITRHDINNQLALLRGHLALLSKKYDNASVNGHIEQIDTSAECIASLIQFTKEYEEIGTGVPVWQDCRALIGRAASRIQLGSTGMKNDIAPGMEIFADPMVVKVFENLMDNSVRYGRKITTIRFSVQERKDDCLIVYEDNGEGIQQEEKERIFERGVGKNTGLGLFLVREILAITGITIKENGEPGKGARFEMFIPKGKCRLSGFLPEGSGNQK